MENLISVIITIYNNEEHLKDCILSVISQTYRNMEIILVDDGSTDSSSKICNELLLSNSKMKVHHQLHLGLAEARNKGLSLATGNYITFMNGSDLMDNNYLENIHRMISSYDIDIAMCPTYRDNTQKTNFSTIITFDKNDCIRQLLIENNICNTPCGKAFSRTLFDTVKFSGDDAQTVYRLVENSSKIAFMNNECYYLRDFPLYPINSCLDRDLRLMKSYPELSTYCRCDIVRNIQNEYYNAISNNKPIIDDDRLYETFTKILKENDLEISRFFDYNRRAHLYLLANDKQNYKIICPVLPELY